MIIAVSAVQGTFLEHQNLLTRIGVESFPLREQADLERPFDGLILPGGDCDKQSRLLRQRGLMEPIRERISQGMPVLGTCSGMILLARQVENSKAPYYLGTMPITVRRRQLPSFQVNGAFAAIRSIPMRFLNAPVVTEMDDEVEILSLTRGEVTAARYENQLVTSFHPEMTTDPSVHHYFKIMVDQAIKRRERGE
ncbi:MAG: pyridoxal 5'-phosphate synthase glutaminase subunit PdxT [Clostridiales bacterium]|nr:pyridoxal 5'-phosphate synthase glutaminase subunit PdxT [Clostridiales bacterium]